MSQKITARFMIQIAGKPVANVQKALDEVKKKLSEEKKFKVLDSEIIEPELDEESSMYSGLLEVGIKFEGAEPLMEFILDYTPNSVEIEDPEEFKFDSASFTGILNDMSSHMLKTHIKLRQLNATVYVLNKQLQELKNK